MSFNWCFIGAGTIAKRVAKQLVTNPGQKLVSIYNRTKARAVSFANIYNCKVYENAFDAINDPEVDGVYIATTNETHFSFVKMCLENHKPVLCEKPITGNAKELEELIKLSKENNTFLCEAMWTWFNPIAKIVKKAIQDERIGKIISADCRFNVPIFGYRKKGSRYSSPERYGGALLDLGVYPIHYIYELFGTPKSIQAKAKLYNGIDIFNESIFEYEGFNVKVSSRCDMFTGVYCKIVGEKGSINVPLFLKATKAILKTKDGKQVIRDKDKQFAREFKTSADDIKAGKLESDVTLESSLAVTKIMDEIRRQIGVIFPCDK